MANDNRKQYETATALTQAFLDASHDNLVNKLELIVDIEKPGGGYLRASDRNKYVVDAAGAGTFYEALLVFPVIKRTVGQYQSPTLEFSTLEIELSNVDGRFNHMLPAGSNYAGWVGRAVTVKLGLGERADTYQTIFHGFITEQGGFKRGVSSITFVARDRFDSINKTFPTQAFTESAFPMIEQDKVNTSVPVIYGDWTVNVEPRLASIPAVVVNGADPGVNGDTGRANVQLVIANHPLVSFDQTQVYLRRGEKAWLIPASDVVNVATGATPASFELVQAGGTLTAITPDTDSQPFEYGSGDDILVKVKGRGLGAGLDDNLVAQVKDILKTYGGLVDADFDANWGTYQAKASPAPSAIANIKCRAWVQEPENVLEFALSLLEQVRLEAFISRDLKLKLLSLHPEDFQASPTFTVRNWDVAQGSFRLSLDERTNFNRAKAVFNLLPNRKENFQETKVYKNDLSIAQGGKAISKKIVFPNLYEEAVVVDQLRETLRITSSYLEQVDVTLTWRSMLLDVGDFVKLNVKIQSTEFTDVPALIREVGYDPSGMKVPLKLWSFQMLPFPGYVPGYPGTVGGSTATIDEET